MPNGFDTDHFVAELRETRISATVMFGVCSMAKMVTALASRGLIARQRTAGLSSG